MKTLCKPSAIALAAILQLFTLNSRLSTLHASVPLAWEVRPGQPAPVMFDRYHGETLSFSATFRGFGELPFEQDADIRLWYQTNGMGQAWWSVPATIQSNVLSATWSPALDPGAERVSLFFGAPSNAYAAAVLRLRHSPGFAPGAMPAPESFRESDPVFAAWLATYTPPDTSLEPSTNYTDRALSSFAATGTVVRALSVGTPTRWTDATGCVWECGFTAWTMTDPYSDVFEFSSSSNGVFQWANEGSVLTFTPPTTWTLFIPDGNAMFTAGKDTLILEEGEFLLQRPNSLVGTNLAGRVALTNDIPTMPEWAKEPSPPSYSAADVGAAPASLVQAVTNIQVESALVYRLYSGSNVVAEVTNYNSQVHAPELRLMQLNESNEYITVWTETNGLSRTLRAATNYADRAIADHAAPRAWSKVTAGMGVEAPSNTTWLSTGRTVIAGGLEYEKHVTSNGAIWLLQSNGMTADFHPQTNNVAFLDLSNADGTPIFRVEKTDSFLVGVHVDAVTVDGNALVCHVPVVASEHPLVRIRATLTEGDWAKEEDGIPASLATVTWSGSVGDWTCRIQNNTGGSSFFAQMEYLQEGGTKIVNSAPLDVSNGIICKDGIHKVRPVYTNGAITWEVVQ